MNTQALKNKIDYRNWLTLIRSKWEYISVVIPLILTLLVQRGEHVIDNRFISLIGDEPLKIHSIFYIFLLVGQSIGIASSSSLLTLWKRQENIKKQYDIAKKHLYLTIIISLTFAILIKWKLNLIIQHFQINPLYINIAEAYLNIGIVNIVIQALLGLTLTLLVASDQILISFILMTFLFGAKFLVGFFSTHSLVLPGFNSLNIIKTMTFIGSMGVLVVIFLLAVGLFKVLSHVKYYQPVKYKEIFEVWNAEVLVSFIRALAPTVFSAQLAVFNKQESFFVIYQMALQLAYLLVIPIIAANQIAVRDASNEQSLNNNNLIISLKQANWFKNYFSCIFIPNFLILCICVLYPENLFNFIFNFKLDFQQSQFVSLYFIAVIIGQIGNLMLVRLRSIKKNRIISMNTFIAEIVVQLGLLQLLIKLQWSDSRLLGLVVILYCVSHLVLNSLSVLHYSEKGVRI